jgi:LysM repeat protein
MRFAPRLLALILISPLLTQCGMQTAPQTNAVTGPFDDKGNYIEDWVDQPNRWFKPNAPTEKKAPSIFAKKQKPAPQIAVVQQPVKPSTATATPTQTKPKPVVVKPKPKPKPVTVRHTVKKGDTLSGLARKYGSSVSKIQSANRIKGTVIRLGQTLTIPK